MPTISVFRRYDIVSDDDLKDAAALLDDLAIAPTKNARQK
jgi:hypothetical protein